MGDCKIVVEVEGGGGGVGGRGSLRDEFDRATELRVRHERGACMPCRMNNDPANVPFWGCNGNIDRIDPDDGKGNLCRCTVVLASDEHAGDYR